LGQQLVDFALANSVLRLSSAWNGCVRFAKVKNVCIYKCVCLYAIARASYSRRRVLINRRTASFTDEIQQ